MGVPWVSHLFSRNTEHDSKLREARSRSTVACLRLHVMDLRQRIGSMILDVMTYLEVFDKLLLTSVEGSLGYSEDYFDNDKATSECTSI